MSSLIPYRPWNLPSGEGFVEGNIEELRNPERNRDDRSPFVRYARSAAMWAEWVRNEVATFAPEVQNPLIDIEGHSFRYGLIHLESLTPLVSVPPSAKDHQQRLLEATQLYSEPIVVFPIGERYVVVGNHELYAAANAYQTELARPGKLRPSDYCLVAICDPAYLNLISPQPLFYSSDTTTDRLAIKLAEAGLDVSPRTDDPNHIALFANEKTFSFVPSSGQDWVDRLREVLGIRSMDFGSNDPDISIKPDQTKVTLLSPPLTLDILKMNSEFPYGAYETNIKPLPGANMWSLRDFRIG